MSRDKYELGNIPVGDDKEIIGMDSRQAGSLCAWARRRWPDSEWTARNNDSKTGVIIARTHLGKDSLDKVSKDLISLSDRLKALSRNRNQSESR